MNASSTVPGSFVYTPAVGNVPAAGTDTLSVTFTPTDTTSYSTATKTVQIVVTQATPVITWANPASITFGTALSATQLNATASVPGNLVYTPAIGNIAAAGTDTLSVTFTPTDTTSYSTVTKTVSLTVTQAASTITWANPASITYGTALSATQLNATASVPGTLVYTPASGNIPAAGTDTLSVTFTPTDTTDYSSATKTVQIVVTQSTPVITWGTPASITFGTALSTTQLDATASVPGTFVYTPAVGNVPAAGTDTLSVTFTPTDAANYTTATKTVQIAVTQAASNLSWATPAGITYGTALSATQLDATSTVPGTFVYTPAAGNVPAAGTDTLSVTFTPTDTTSYSTATKTVQIVVTQATPTITWNNPASITYGTALSATQLNATSSVPGNLVYTPAIGNIPAAGTDTLSVTFTPTDTTNYTTVTKTVSLTVTQGTPTITWANPASITYGTPLSATQLNASASVPGNLVYTPAIGNIPAAGTDTLSVTFTPTDTANYSSATKTVQIVVTQATPVITWANPAGITYGTALSTTQLNATASVPGSFAYTPAIGNIPTSGTDTLSVTFTPTDTASYTTVVKTVQIVVSQASSNLSWSTPASITYGTALSATQLNATSTVAGTFVYTPAAGNVPAAGTDTLSVTFTPNDTTNYSAATKTVQIVVTQATPVITWGNPAGITYGTALSATQLNATASVPGNLVYTPAIGNIPGAGTDTLSVTFTPTDTANYSTVTKTVQIVVTQATPVVTWNNPASITYGTALSAFQLNATASVPGSFAYTPAAGSTPAAGTDTLSVTFTPTDSSNYTTATKTVQIVVTQATPVITWANPASITYGTTLSNIQLDASTPVAGNFTYTPAAGNTPSPAPTRSRSSSPQPTPPTTPPQPRPYRSSSPKPLPSSPGPLPQQSPTAQHSPGPSSMRPHPFWEPSSTAQSLALS
ncbi:beta strand repeat-containing protein [Tunturiibacter gelidiferens]|uniref:beta strand repeat-containing protein n=1 Tax=Tunturiibacter gelidiferens TaxID=3069689 RepID=UPI003D9BC517